MYYVSMTTRLSPNTLAVRGCIMGLNRAYARARARRGTGSCGASLIGCSIGTDLPGLGATKEKDREMGLYNRSGGYTKFTRKVLEKAQWYVAGGYKDRGDEIPTLAGLCSLLRISQPHFHNWVKEHELATEIYFDIKNEQERVTLAGGLRGTYNAQISKAVLAKHGYTDRVDHAHTSPDGTMTPAPTRIEIVAPVETHDNGED